MLTEFLGRIERGELSDFGFVPEAGTFMSLFNFNFSIWEGVDSYVFLFA
jgi:hypothetical protein